MCLFCTSVTVVHLLPGDKICISSSSSSSPSWPTAWMNCTTCALKPRALSPVCHLQSTPGIPEMLISLHCFVPPGSCPDAPPPRRVGHDPTHHTRDQLYSACTFIAHAEAANNLTSFCPPSVRSACTHLASDMQSTQLDSKWLQLLHEGPQLIKTLMFFGVAN